MDFEKTKGGGVSTLNWKSTLGTGTLCVKRQAGVFFIECFGDAGPLFGPIHGGCSSRCDLARPDERATILAIA